MSATPRPDLGVDPAEDAIAAMALFGKVLDRIDVAHLGLPTPCTDWDVEALISHVVLGDASIPLLFDGEPLDLSTPIDTAILGPNPMATWRGTALAAIDVLRRPGAMEQLVDHPTGRQPGALVARFRLVDLLGHSWDLATAAGIEFEMPEALAEAALDFLFPMIGQLGESQYFDPPLAPPEDSPASVRVLALIGRQAW